MLTRLRRAGPLLFLGGVALAVAPAGALVRSAGPCVDVASRIIYVRSSTGLGLPVPVVQNCTHALPLYLLFTAGFLIAALGTLVLTASPLSRRSAAFLALAGVALASSMPYLSNSDAYSYAFYAYESFVLKQSPYFFIHGNTSGVTGHTLAQLFPGESNPLRTSTYGPLFVAMYSAVIGPVAALGLKAMIVAERLFAAAALVVLGLLVACAEPERRNKTRAFAAIVLNPLMLFESISFAHGDVFMLVLAAAAYVLYRRGLYGFAAAACVLAIEVRSVAVLALAALLWELLCRRAFTKALIAGACAAATAGATWFWAMQTYGAFRLAGPYFFAAFSAPATIVSGLVMGDTLPALRYGTIAEAAIGIIVVYYAMRERKYALLPFAAFAGLPGVEPWYAQWLAPAAALTSNRGFRRAAIAFMIVAPLQMIVEISTVSNYAAVHAVTVCVQWLVPLAAYLSAVLDAKLQLQLLKYYTCGALAILADVATFQALILLGLAAPAAAACAYGVAAGGHFIANRVWTFGALDRRASDQAFTYALVVSFGWCVTVAVVAWGTGPAHLAPLAAKGLAIAATLPIGFLGHKYLTYGAGPRAVVAALRTRFLQGHVHANTD